MLEEETTPAPEEIESEETVNDDQEEGESGGKEETIGDLHKTEDKKQSDSENIPKARLDKEISRRKALEKELADLKAKEDAEDITPAEESKKSDLESRLEKIENEKKEVERDAAIKRHLDKALEDSPEFKEIVNPDVIKQMVLNPANKDKTYSQLLEEAYGNAISGKRTIETTTPRGGAKDQKVDINRAKKDTEYRREVLADPELRRQYNENIQDRIPL